ncbi:MAG: hypothetical protein KAG14_01750, partial [Mycoplasmataceae bacterium]|nr:hypothetical protein [Mycoplasmataceae bacterium]
MKNKHEKIFYEGFVEEFQGTLDDEENRVISLTGNFGIGKSSFLKKTLTKEKYNVKWIDANEVMETSDNVTRQIRSSNGFYSKSKKLLSLHIWVHSFYKYILSMYIPLVIGIVSLLAAINIGTPNIYYSSLMLIPFVAVLLFDFVSLITSFIIGRTLNRSRKKVLVIDNLDRISNEQFVKIIEMKKKKTITVIFVYDLENLITRYEERFGFEPKNLMGMIEKYSDINYDLTQRITNEYEYIFEPIERLENENDIKYIINWLKDINYTNFRVVKMVISKVHANYSFVENAGILLSDYFFIILLRAINYVEFNKLYNDELFVLETTTTFSRKSKEEEFSGSSIKGNDLFKNIILQYISIFKYHERHTAIKGEIKKIIWFPSEFEEFNNQLSNYWKLPTKKLLSNYNLSNDTSRRLIIHIIKDRGQFGIENLKHLISYDFSGKVLWDSNFKILDLDQTPNYNFTDRIIILINIINALDVSYSILPRDYMVTSYDYIMKSTNFNKERPKYHVYMWVLKEMKALIKKANEHDGYKKEIKSLFLVEDDDWKNSLPYRMIKLFGNKIDV